MWLSFHINLAQVEASCLYVNVHHPSFFQERENNDKFHCYLDNGVSFVHFINFYIIFSEVWKVMRLAISWITWGLWLVIMVRAYIIAHKIALRNIKIFFQIAYKWLAFGSLSLSLPIILSTTFCGVQSASVMGFNSKLARADLCSRLEVSVLSASFMV